VEMRLVSIQSPFLFVEPYVTVSVDDDAHHISDVQAVSRSTCLCEYAPRQGLCDRSADRSCPLLSSNSSFPCSILKASPSLAIGFTVRTAACRRRSR
jgi:hypothetical protein